MVHEAKGNQIQSWKDLLKSFLSQYDHEVDTAPDRMSLMTKEKKETKSFKEYTQRWRDLAFQVQPLLTEKEITFIFVDTILAPYYDKMIGNAMRNFSEMVLSM